MGVFTGGKFALLITGFWAHLLDDLVYFHLMSEDIPISIVFVHLMSEDDVPAFPFGEIWTNRSLEGIPQKIFQPSTNRLPKPETNWQQNFPLPQGWSQGVRQYERLGMMKGSDRMTVW